MERSSRLPRRARVADRLELCGTGTVWLAFEVIDDEPFGFEPGEFVAVDVDHPRLGYRRSPYCIASPVSRPERFDLLVRVVPQGPVSLFLASLAPGDVIGFRGPMGRALRPDETRALELLATGVGIGPLLPLCVSLLRRGFPHAITLYWGLRLAEDICLTATLDSWVEAFPTFSYHVSLSRPPPGWRGLRGRLTESVPPLLKTVTDRSYALCGNGAMVAEMREALSLAGVPQRQLHEEVFFNLRHRPALDEVEAIRRRFRAPDVRASPFAEIERFMD